MRKHLSVFALCIRAKLWKLLLTLAAAAGISTAVFFILGLERAWGNGGGPGILALRIRQLGKIQVYLPEHRIRKLPAEKRRKTAEGFQQKGICHFLRLLRAEQRAQLFLGDVPRAALSLSGRKMVVKPRQDLPLLGHFEIDPSQAV